MATDRRRHPLTTRQENTPANPDPNADQPVIVAVPQAPHDPNHDVVDFPPTYARGVIIGDPETIGITEDGVDDPANSDGIPWGMASPNFAQTAGAEAGWRIQANGDAEFNNVTVRGTVAASSIVANTSVNLCPNGDFETGISGWTAVSNCSIAQETVSPTGPTSAACLKITPTAAGDCYITTPTGLDGIVCEPTTVYQLQRWVRSESTPRGTYCYPTFYDSDGNICTATEAGIHAYWLEGGNAWVLSNPFSFLSPDNAAFMTINVAVLSAGSSSEWHAIDDVTVYKSSYMEGGMIIVPRIATGLYDTENTGIELDSDGTVVFLPGDVDCTRPGQIYGSQTAAITDATRQGQLIIAPPVLATGDNTNYLSVRSKQSDGSTTLRQGLYLSNMELTTTTGTDYLTLETAYGSTSSFTAATTNPTGRTWAAYYTRLGRVVQVWVNTGFGGSMTAGSGAYNFAVPLAIDTTFHPQGAALGEATASLSSTNYPGVVRVFDANTVRVTATPSGTWTNSGPATPVANDKYWLHFSYLTSA